MRTPRAELTYHPFQVEYDHADGQAPQQAPAEESFWVASPTGTETLALDWEPTAGDWRAVVMNADDRAASPPSSSSARTSLLWWVGAALLGAGVLGAAAAAALYACRRAEHLPPLSRGELPRRLPPRALVTPSLVPSCQQGE